MNKIKEILCAAWDLLKGIFGLIVISILGIIVIIIGPGIDYCKHLIDYRKKKKEYNIFCP